MKKYIPIYENGFISKPKYKFIGVCDRLRLNSDENESKWQNMMGNKKSISDALFLQLVDVNNILDEDEDAQTWVAENKRQDIDAGAYKSNWGNVECILFQVAGFEYIFIKNNQDIVNENAFIPIFESPDTIYYKTIDWEDSDPSFKRPKFNSVYNSIDALAFGVENDEAAITPFGFTHSNSYVARDGWMIRMRHASRETFNFPGRIWLKDKIISFYGTISSKDAKRVIPLLQKSISDFYDSYLLFNKNYEKNRNETRKLFYKYFANIDDADQHDVKFAFDEETNHLEYIHKNIEYLKEIKENGLGDFFIEYSEYDEETEIGKMMIFKVSDFINKDYTGSKPTEEELSMEHTVSPLEKTKEPVPSGIGSQKEPSLKRKAELSGVPIGEMKEYVPVFENPDFVLMKRPNLGFATFRFLNPNTIAFGIINNELKIGHLKAKHTELLDINNGKITSLDDYARSDYKYPGRIWIGSNIISFWEYPKSYELKQILIDIQKELKKLYDIYKPVSDFFDNELSDDYTPESLYLEKPKEYSDLIKLLSKNEVLNARDFDLFDQYHHQIKKIIDNGMDMFIVDIDSYTGEPMEGKPVLDYMKSNTIINTNKEQVEHMESPLKKKNNNNYNKGSEAPMTLKRKAELSGVAIGESANTVSKGYVLKELEDEYGIDLELWDNGNCLILHKIIIPKSERKLNIGTEIMNKIINYADGVQKPIFLTPSIDYGATSVNRLKRFYRQFGFEKNKDTSTTWESMVRFPKLNEMKSYMKVYENFVPILENKWDAGILERDELNEPITDGDDVYVFRAASKKEVNNVLNNNDNSGAFWGSKLEYSNDFHMVAKSSKKGISFAWNMKREPDNIKAVVDEYGFKDIRTPNETFERNYDPHFDHFQQVGTKYKKEDIVAIYDERNNLIYSNQDKEINEISGIPIGEGIKQYVQIFENPDHIDLVKFTKDGNPNPEFYNPEFYDDDTQNKDRELYDISTLSVSDNDTIVFGYMDDVLLFNIGSTHNGEHMYYDELDVSIKTKTSGGRNDLQYAARWWVYKNIISFWDYPPPGNIREIISTLINEIQKIVIILLDETIKHCKDILITKIKTAMSVYSKDETFDESELKKINTLILELNQSDNYKNTLDIINSITYIDPYLLKKLSHISNGKYIKFTHNANLILTVTKYDISNILIEIPVNDDLEHKGRNTYGTQEDYTKTALITLTEYEKMDFEKIGNYTQDELKTEHNISPLKKEKKTISPGFGSETPMSLKRKAELSGVPIGEGIKQYVQIFENSVSDWQGYVDKIPMLKSGIEVLDKIIKIGNENNITDPRAYIVGGTIRDIITGQKKPDDIDIATNVPVDILEKHFKTFDIGKNKDFGIIVALHGGFDFEIANFRKDGLYTDGRRPDDVEIVTSYEDDASRRDFTINAMGVDREGNVIDYFDGKGDIKDKKIRTVGNPTSRITEDPVRMLRGVRFASTLNFDIDDETFAAIKANAPSIGSVSKERITKELYKMADQEGPKFAKALEILYDSGLLQEILPDIAKMKEFEHNSEHHPEGGVWKHVMAAIAANPVKDKLLNLAILFHDIGKPSTYEKSEEKGHTYHKHESEGEKIIHELAKELKLPNDDRDALKFAAKQHMNMHNFTKLSPKKALGLIKDKNWNILKGTALADAKSRGEKFNVKDWEEIQARETDLTTRFPDEAESQKEFQQNIIRQFVGGKQVMTVLDLKKGGPIIGKIQEVVSDWIINNDIKDQVKINDKIKETYSKLTGDTDPLNEERLEFTGGGVDIYKNPKSIKRMSPWKRAVSDKEGNLFVLDDPSITMVHGTFTGILYNKGYIKHEYGKGFVFGQELLMWMQVGNSNIFCLSESDFFTKVDSGLIKIVQEQNPQFKFVPKRIWRYAKEIGSHSTGNFELLNEEQIKDFQYTNTSGEDFIYEVYKNPHSIKRFAPYARAISDSNGDLFVIDDAENVIHSTLLKWLDVNGLIAHSGEMPFYYNELLQYNVSWQRNGKTNEFYLSESYNLDSPDSDYHVSEYKNMEALIEKTRSKNPNFKFIFDSIHNAKESENLKFKQYTNIYESTMEEINNFDVDAEKVIYTGKDVWDIVQKYGSEHNDSHELLDEIKKNDYVLKTISLLEVLKSDPAMMDYIEEAKSYDEFTKYRKVFNPIVIGFDGHRGNDVVIDGSNRIAQHYFNGDKMVRAFIPTTSSMVSENLKFKQYTNMYESTMEEINNFDVDFELQDLHNTSTFEYFKQFYELEYKYQATKNFNYNGNIQRKENIQKIVIDKLESVIKSLSITLHYTYDNWLKGHSAEEGWKERYGLSNYFDTPPDISAPNVIPEMLYDYKDNNPKFSGTDPLKQFDNWRVLNELLNEAYEKIDQIPVLSKLHNFANLGNKEGLYNELSNNIDEFNSNQDTNFETEDEAQEYIEELDVKIFDTIFGQSVDDFVNIFNAYYNYHGIDLVEDFAEQIHKQVIYPHWVVNWSGYDIQSAIQNNTDIRKKLDNIEEYPLNEQIIIFHKALNGVHATGNMMEHYDGRFEVSKSDLDNLSDQYVKDWDKELALMGFVINSEKSMPVPVVENLSMYLNPM